MDNDLWIALLVCAAGTFLIRMVPLVWMQRHLTRKQNSDEPAAMPVWLGVLGPTMIAAMLGVSLVPVTPSPASWGATLAGCLATLLVWHKTRSLGWPVVIGVSVFGLVEVSAGLLV